MRALLALSFVSAVAGAVAQQEQNRPELDTARIEQLTGASGTYDAKEQVFKVTVPRSDLRVTVAGVKMSPPMGLTSWAAFKRAGEHGMVMGDMTLLEDEVYPVMRVALESGLEVTALHNHFLWDEPRVMFMHIGGMGKVDALAAAVGKVFARIRDASGGGIKSPQTGIDPAKTSLDPSRIESVLGVKGQMADGVYKLTIGRTAQAHGHEIGGAMGVNTWAAFAGSDEKAVVDGDFVMLESELQPVLESLVENGIHVVAIHNHMTEEKPRMMFLHYWGIGSTDQLATALKRALGTQGS